MFAGVGRVSPANNVGREQDGAADIPEWKKLLIMRKRSGAYASSDDSKTAVDQTRSHFRGPVTTSTNDVGNRRVGSTAHSTCESAAPGYGNKFSPVRASKTAELDFREGENTSSANTNNSETPCKTVTRTIGNINVELRNVSNSSSESPEIFRCEKSEGISSRYLISPLSESAYPSLDLDEDEDLQYGPGIVDRLRAKFLNMGLKNCRKPVVRKFSSLENLSAGVGGPFRASGIQHRGERRFGIRATGNLNELGYAGGNVKKAQSMETLLVGARSEQSMLMSSCANQRFYTRTLNSRNSNSPGSVFSGEADKSPRCVSEVSSRIDHKICRRREYSRQVSAPNINEDEMPKPDTVKHFKRIFESPNASAEKSCNAATCSNNSNANITFNGHSFRTTSVLGTAGKPHSSAINTNAQGKKAVPNKLTSKSDDLCAKPSAKTNTTDSSLSDIDLPPILSNDGDSTQSKFEETLEVKADEKNVLSASSECDEGDSQMESKVNKSGHAFISENILSPTKSPEAAFAQAEDDVTTINTTTDCAKSSVDSNECVVDDNLTSPDVHTESPVDSPPPKVIAEQLPLPIESEEGCSEEQFQGSQVASEPEHTEDDNRQVESAEPDLAGPSRLLGGMVVATSPDDGDSSSSPADSQLSSPAETSSPNIEALKPSAVKKPSNWQKPPQTTTSIVFDFRGKDVKPNISLNPTPFGCRPAKVPRSSLTKKRSGSPPWTDLKVNGIDNVDHPCSDDDEEDWNEMDIGADLPILSGVVFTGENIKIGRGALLETRNKKLTIQFDDGATSTFEYPSETAFDEDLEHPSVKSSLVIGVDSGLLNYTPHGLSSNDDFQLGISRPTHWHCSAAPTNTESAVTVTDDLVPADPAETMGWSATDTSDILF